MSMTSMSVIELDSHVEINAMGSHQLFFFIWHFAWQIVVLIMGMIDILCNLCPKYFNY